MTTQTLNTAKPAPAAVPDEAFNIIEAIRAELTWPGWRKTSSRDWVMDMISELLSMLTAAPQPAEEQPVCPTCPDCAGSGKTEHSITVQESDVERRK